MEGETSNPRIHRKLKMSDAIQHIRRIFRVAKEETKEDSSHVTAPEQVFTDTWALWPSRLQRPDKLLEQVMKGMDVNISVSEYDGRFDDSCGWPRRLLHVPTMTSLEWRPGNIYGGVKEPDYTAISYTWGRFRLRGNDMPDVKAINIKGVPWSIPRVDPEHFSADTLEKVLRMAMLAPCWSNFDPDDTKDMEKHAVQFVWIDVACIDQADRYMQLQEVGRQVVIFKQAKIVAMWLSSLWDLEIQPQYSVLEEIGTMLGTSYMTGPPTTMSTSSSGAWELFAEAAFRDVMCDPWFSSLWTLQEAFIGLHKSIFLSQSGTPIFLPDQAKYHTSEPFSLAELGGLCYNISHFVGSTSHLYLDNQRVLNVMKFIRESGILSVFQSVEMGTFLAARFRKSTRQEDKIYGIMQVFDLRVGASRPDAREGHTFSLEELEDELGLALLQKDQIIAQLFQYYEPAAYGKAWRPSVGKCSIITGAENKWAIAEKPYEYGGETAFSTKFHDGVTWGYFEGCICPFTTLLKAAQTIDANFILTLDAQPVGGGKDNKEPIPSTGTAKEFQTTAQARSAREGLRQAARNSTSIYNPQDLFILRLSPGFDNHCWGIALVRRKDADSGLLYYHRIGVCEYLAYSHLGEPGSSRLRSDKEYSQSDGETPFSESLSKSILRGDTPDWDRSEGYWG